MKRPSTTPLRAVLYARVSTRGKDQNPESQLRPLREWMVQRGWSIVTEEKDHVTGDPERRKTTPPGLQAALDLLAKGKADVLVVYSVDRLVRSSVELLQIIWKVESFGAHVASLEDAGDLDTTTDIGELMVFLRGWFARIDLKLRRAKTKAGLERKRAEGVRLGRPPLAGDHLPELAAVKRLQEEHLGVRRIARRLGCTPWAVRLVLGCGKTKQTASAIGETADGRES